MNQISRNDSLLIIECLDYINYQYSKYEEQLKISKFLYYDFLKPHEHVRKFWNSLNAAIIEIQYNKNYDSARKYLDKSNIELKYMKLELAEEDYLENKKHYLNTIGAFYEEIGEINAALLIYNELIENSKSYNFSAEEQCIFYQNKSVILTRSYRFQEALDCLNQISSQTPTHTDLELHTSIELNKAYLYAKLGDYETSIKTLYALNPFLQQPFKDRELRLIKRDIRLAQNYAEMLRSKSKYQFEAETIKKKLISKLDNGDLTPYFTIVYLRAIGELYEAEKDYDKADQYYQKAIQNCLGNQSNQMADVQYHHLLFEILKSKINLIQNQPVNIRKSAYIKYTNMMLNLIDFIRDYYRNEQQKYDFTKEFFPFLKVTMNKIVQFYHKTNDKELLDLAFQISDRSKAAVLEEIRAEQRAAFYMVSDDRSAMPEAQLNRIKLVNLKTQLLEATDKQTIKKLSDKIQQLEVEYLSTLDKNDHQILSREKASIAAIQQKLAITNCSVIEFFFGKDSVFIFHISDNHIEISSTEILTLVNNTFYYLNNLKKSNYGTFQAFEEGFMLYEKLIKPFENNFHDRVVIIPDDILYLLPFEALPTQLEGGQYLLEKYTMSKIYSSSFLRVDLNHQVPDFSQGIAFAPFYQHQQSQSSSRSQEYGALAHSLKEIELIGEQLLGDLASKDAFLASAKSKSLIHLATHALVDSLHHSSCVVFHPHTGQGSFKLYSHEIAQMDLSSADLVVVNACKSGWGRITPGEGVLSLGQAITKAGANNSLLNIWDANDAITATITSDFYRYYAQNPKYGQAAALRQAQLAFLNGQHAGLNPRYQPQLWSNFLLFGDIQINNDQSRISYGYLMMIIFIFTLFTIGFYIKKIIVSILRNKASI